MVYRGITRGLKLFYLHRCEDSRLEYADRLFVLLACFPVNGGNRCSFCCREPRNFDICTPQSGTPKVIAARLVNPDYLLGTHSLHLPHGADRDPSACLTTVDPCSHNKKGNLRRALTAPPVPQGRLATPLNTLATPGSPLHIDSRITSNHVVNTRSVDAPL